MTEAALQIIVALKPMYLAGFVYLYGLGGMNNKAIRRIGGAVYLTAGVVLFSVIERSFSWYFLLYAPLLYGALSLGYGAATTKTKIVKRLLSGSAVGVSALPIAVVTGQWFMFGLHIVVCALVSVVMGVTNPISARAEESAIAAFYGLLPLYMVS